MTVTFGTAVIFTPEVKTSVGRGVGRGVGLGVRTVAVGAVVTFADGVRVGDGEGVGVFVGVGVGVGVGLGVGVGDGVGIATGSFTTGGCRGASALNGCAST